jgi:hypothetical protein
VVAIAAQRDQTGLVKLVREHGATR